MLSLLGKTLELYRLNKLWKQLWAIVPKEQLLGWSGVHTFEGIEDPGEDDETVAAQLIFDWAEQQGLDLDWVLMSHQAVLNNGAIITQRIIWADSKDEPNIVRYLAKYHYVDFVLA